MKVIIKSFKTNGNATIKSNGPQKKQQYKQTHGRVHNEASTISVPKTYCQNVERKKIKTQSKHFGEIADTDSPDRNA